MITYACWIETKSPDSTEWQHYEHLEDEEEADPPGLYLAYEGMCGGVNNLAQTVLDRFLASVLRAHADQLEIQVRACAQVHDQTSVGPNAIREASPDGIAETREALRLEALTKGLRSACHLVYDARRSLQKTVVKAHSQGLDLRSITTAVASQLDAKSVARLIDAPALFREVQALVATRPALAGRIAVRNAGLLGVKVELLWSNEDHDAEQLRERAWNESIEDYDPELAVTLLSAARRDARELLTLLSAQFEVTFYDEPATPGAMAPFAVIYQPVTVRRPTVPAVVDETEGAAA
ncbi:hypothetical protein ACFRCW_19290 [Streptomyces sp. NPDC056653]|uniref:hypothetical protein n=1 Tax=Streptomyces sp. NPDC056653 TaxID=3345894 RepID=UPI003680FACD